MFRANDTFSIGYFFRGFTLTIRKPRTEETFTMDNQSFVGDDIIINYQNI